MRLSRSLGRFAYSFSRPDGGLQPDARFGLNRRMRYVMAAQEISLEALGLLQALLHHDYDEAQFRANHVARHALQHEHLSVADAAERIESLLACGCPNAMELRIALRSLATSVDRMQDAAMRRAGHLL
jgi:hypothetical protein